MAMETRSRGRPERRIIRRARFGTQRVRGRLAWAPGLGVLLILLADFGNAAAQDCSLAYIHDGDTLNLRCAGDRVKVRLHCIDAPEIEQRPWGVRSRDYLRAITPRRVTLRAREIDSYGRTVGDVFTPAGRSLNLAMVRSGQAAVYARFCGDSAFYRAERTARRERLGVWAHKGLQQTPWAWRHR
jgi:endonuclease YncB( thermonuclease family)